MRPDTRIGHRPSLPRFYSGFTVSYELKNSNEALWEGLEHGLYQIIIVHEETGKSLKCPDEFFSFPYRQENLSLWVPHEHPLSALSELELKDLAYQNILLYTHIGFWYEMCKEKLPDAHFLYMNEFDAFSRFPAPAPFHPLRLMPLPNRDRKQVKKLSLSQIMKFT